MPVFYWGGIVVSIGFALVSFLGSANFDDDEYMFSNIFIYMPSFFLIEIGLICGTRDIAANKLVRSFPIAEELYSRSVPIFIIILTLGVSAVAVAAYFIFLGIIGAEPAQFADTLVIGAVICAAELIISPFFAMYTAGGILVMYCVLILVWAFIFILEKLCGIAVMQNGFGIPLWAAALIFAAAAAAGSALTFVIAKRRFKKSNIKINGMMTYNELGWCGK